jgi:hypothetical protein
MSDAVPALPHGKRYSTFRQTAERHQAFPEGSLRWLRFNGGKNGFNACVIKIGRRIFIDDDAFEQWIEAHRDGQVPNAEAFERWLASDKVSGVVSSTTEAAEKLSPQFGPPRVPPKQRAQARSDAKPEAKSARRTSSNRKPALNEIGRTT